MVKSNLLDAGISFEQHKSGDRKIILQKVPKITPVLSTPPKANDNEVLNKDGSWPVLSLIQNTAHITSNEKTSSIAVVDGMDDKDGKLGTFIDYSTTIELNADTQDSNSPCLEEDLWQRLFS